MVQSFLGQQEGRQIGTLLDPMELFMIVVEGLVVVTISNCWEPSMVQGQMSFLLLNSLEHNGQIIELHFRQQVTVQKFKRKDESELEEAVRELATLDKHTSRVRILILRSNFNIV